MESSSEQLKARSWVANEPLTYEDKVDKEKAVECLQYGVQMFRVNDWGYQQKRLFMLHHNNKFLLQRISQKYKPKDSRVDLLQVSKINFGIGSFVYRNIGSYIEQRQINLCISLLYHERNSVLDLLFEDENQMKLVVTGLQIMIKEAQIGLSQCFQCSKEEIFKKMQVQFDANDDSRLTQKETIKIIENNYYNRENKNLKEVINQLSLDKKGLLNHQQFKNLMNNLRHYDGVNDIFERYKDQKTNIINSDGLSKFMSQEQKVEKSLEECLNIISEVVSGQCGTQVQPDAGMTLADFGEYLFSPILNNVLDPQKVRKTTDMTQPLTKYFCLSSHNTYLSGHQLVGDSDDLMYEEALRLGFRCIELDCWDGDGPLGEPMITHGYTLTSKITMKSVLKVIKQSAFKTNPYPVIFSFEMHCSKPQQSQIAVLVSEILGVDNVLMLPDDLESCSNTCELTTFASPETLKNKFIIKCKGRRIIPDCYRQRFTDEELKSFDKAKLSKEQISLRQPVAEKKNQKNLSGQEESQDEEVKTENILVCEDLSKIVAMISATYIRGKPYMPWEIQSYESSKIKNLVKSEEDRVFWQIHNSQHFTRVYPKGTNFGSGNFNPFISWAIGSQFVALNLQTKDEFQLLNFSYFLQHGGYNSGYVLKSPQLLGQRSEQPIIRKLSFEIISGYQIPKKSGNSKNKVDPYVVVKLYSTAFPQQPQVIIETGVVKKNGFNPVWGKEHTFQYNEEDINMLVVSVHDEDASLLCWNALSVDCLQQGYRAIEMRLEDFCIAKQTSLLCKVVHI